MSLFRSLRDPRHALLGLTLAAGAVGCQDLDIAPEVVPLVELYANQLLDESNLQATFETWRDQPLSLRLDPASPGVDPMAVSESTIPERLNNLLEGAGLRPILEWAAGSQDDPEAAAALVDAQIAGISEQIHDAVAGLIESEFAALRFQHIQRLYSSEYCDVDGEVDIRATAIRGLSATVAEINVHADPTGQRLRLGFHLRDVRPDADLRWRVEANGWCESGFTDSRTEPLSLTTDLSFILDLSFDRQPVDVQCAAQCCDHFVTAHFVLGGIHFENVVADLPTINMTGAVWLGPLPIPISVDIDLDDHLTGDALAALLTNALGPVQAPFAVPLYDPTSPLMVSTADVTATGVQLGLYHDTNGNPDNGYDSDGDGVCHAYDNCPGVANPDQRDRDGDGIGDACDPCPNDADTRDEDEVCWHDEALNQKVCMNLGDGIHDACDNCPTVANRDQRDTDGRRRRCL